MIFGTVPAWADKLSYGSGYGYGDGDGDGDGYGYGYGYGDGDGDGDGSGDGDGDGDGSGYGSGSGSGYGSGYGDGYGYGYGSGYGSGSGYGDGYGDGDGYGYGYWNKVVENAMQGWTEVQRAKLEQLKQDSGVFLAFWKSSRDGLPSNGGSSLERAVPGLIQTVEGPLELCGNRALHATLNPDKWKGERLWIVALYGDVAINSYKIGALQREIVGEIKQKGN